ncbi:MAG TPA: hypothetical protein DIV86_04665 [Alphaproteobacteria bacterium]|nr:hypothetical protein [Alphaproteobacteria bacterium]
MALPNHQVFLGIEGKSQKILEENCIEKSFKKNSIIYLQEEEQDAVYIIKTGWVKIFRQTLDGEEAITDILNDGKFFGEAAVLENSQHSESAEAIEDTALYQIKLSSFKKVLSDDRLFGLNILRYIARKQASKTLEVEHLTIQNASQRIGCFLMKLCKPENKLNTVLNLPYDKSLIASRLGMKPETFSRALNTLRVATKIEISGSRVTIPEINDIISYTCSACSETYPCKDL